MERNVGVIDAIGRIAAGVALILLGILGPEGGAAGSWLGAGLAIAGLVLLATAATGRCLLYKPFGIDTRGEE